MCVETARIYKEMRDVPYDGGLALFMGLNELLYS